MFNKLVLSGVNLWVRVWLRAAQTETGNKCGGATKKREISRTLLSINIHFSVHMHSVCCRHKGRWKEYMKDMDLMCFVNVCVEERERGGEQ